MYKYLQITTDLKEMMVMLKSLPVNTVVVDKKGKLVDINQPASDFLKIRGINDYRIKRWRVLNDNLNLQKIIHKLKKGEIILKSYYLLNCPNGDFISVNFSASMLNGSCDIFIFQFYEISAFSNAG